MKVFCTCANILETARISNDCSTANWMAWERKYSSKKKNRKSFYLMCNSLEVLISSISGSGTPFSNRKLVKKFTAHARLIGISTINVF